MTILLPVLAAGSLYAEVPDVIRISGTGPEGSFEIFAWTGYSFDGEERKILLKDASHSDADHILIMTEHRIMDSDGKKTELFDPELMGIFISPQCRHYFSKDIPEGLEDRKKIDLREKLKHDMFQCRSEVLRRYMAGNRDAFDAFSFSFLFFKRIFGDFADLLHFIFAYTGVFLFSLTLLSLYLLILLLIQNLIRNRKKVQTAVKISLLSAIGIALIYINASLPTDGIWDVGGVIYYRLNDYINYAGAFFLISFYPSIKLADIYFFPENDPPSKRFAYLLYFFIPFAAVILFFSLRGLSRRSYRSSAPASRPSAGSEGFSGAGGAYGGGGASGSW